jgi:hypothetical protein
MKPICVPCQRFYRPKKNGFPFIEAAPYRGFHVLPGTEEAGDWRPDKLWVGDLWECKGCGAQIVVGTGRSPIVEHFQDNFKWTVEQYKPTLQVNDC